MTSGDRPSGYLGKSSGGRFLCGCAFRATAGTASVGATGTPAGVVAGVVAAAVVATGSARSVCMNANAPTAIAATAATPMTSGVLLRFVDDGGATRGGWGGV